MTRDDDFLSRWSRRKHAANRGEAPAPAPEKAPPAPAMQAPAATSKAEVELPPVESLTSESDFTPFMQRDIDPLVRRQALKTLFRDPRFNVMDGLDVYIDDFSKPDPIPAEWLGKLNQMARLGDYRPPEAPPAEVEKGGGNEDVAPIQAENQGVGDEVAEAEPAPSEGVLPERDSKQSGA